MSRIATFLFILVIFITAVFIFTTAVSKNTPLNLPDEVNNDSFVVLELFTSLSCSSCPDADKHIGLVQEMANKKGLAVFPIAFHVDYWNHLGWIDKFSSELYSERQQQYSRVFKKYNIYTPQIVVNGMYEFIGTNLSVCEKQIYNILKEEPDQNIKIEATFTHVNDSIKIHYSLDQVNTGIVNIALVEVSTEVEIKSGENMGKKINCYNVVRYFTQISCREKSGKVVIKCPEDLDRGNLSILVYQQNKIDMRIRGAVRAKMI